MNATAIGASPDVTTPEGRLQAYIKLRGSLDGARSAWWYRGIQYGVVDLVPHRLWAVQGVQVSRYRARDDGAFDHEFRDLMFYLDLKSGEVLREFHNPLTGQTIHPPVLRVGPMELVYSRAGAAIKDVQNVPPGLETRWRVDRAIVNGDDLILHEEGHSSVPSANVVLNDFITTQGSLAQATDASLLNAPARYSYCSVMTWTPFMQMGDHPGHLMGRGNGRKLRSSQDLTPAFRALVEAEEPGWFDGVLFPDD